VTAAAPARAQLIAAARSYVGTPWRHMGRSRQRLDCVGLLIVAFRDAGLEVAEPPPYAVGRRGPDMVAELAARGDRIPLGEARDGDVLVFADGLHCAHVGLRSTWRGVPAVIHGRRDRGRVVEEPLGADASTTPRLAFRPRGLGD
jgi:hypothetical protein